MSNIMTMTLPATLALALFTLAASPFGAVGTQTGQIITDADSYAVYAAVIPEKFSTGDKPLSELPLLQETRAGSDCLDRDKGRKFPPEWRPVVESFRKKNARAQIIQSGFNLGLPYTIVTVEQLRKLMRDAGYSPQSGASNHPGAEVFARFPGGRLIALSAVGFNADKTRALVAMQYDCFPSWDARTESSRVCQVGQHFTLEKKGGGWNIVRDVAVGCHWIA